MALKKRHKCKYELLGEYRETNLGERADYGADFKFFSLCKKCGKKFMHFVKVTVKKTVEDK